MTRFQPRISRRTPSATLFAEIFQAPGPQQIGETGDNSYATLFGRNWLAVIDRDGVLRAYQEQEPGEWAEVTVDLPPIFGQVLPADVRRISLAFDQSARAITCYAQNGLIHVTRWDTTEQRYVQNVSFSGVDPVVVMDASWTLSVPGSDVLIFYLMPERTGVRVRVQHELYAVANTLYDYPGPVILDRVAALPIRYQLLISDRSGVPIQALLSDPYPLAWQEHVAAEGAFTAAGAYVSVVLSAGGGLYRATATAAPPAAGDYGEAIIEAFVDSGLIGTSAIGPSSGSYGEAVLWEYEGSSLAAAGNAPSAASYTLVVINALPAINRVTASAAGPAGGTYEAA